MITIDDFTRINNDVNGNPRYVFHFTHLIGDNENKDKDGNYVDVPNRYDIAINRAKQIGGKKIPSIRRQKIP